MSFRRRLARAARRVLLPLLPSAALSCAWESNPPPIPTNEELARAQLTELTPPGSFEVTTLLSTSVADSLERVRSVPVVRTAMGDRELLSVGAVQVVHDRGKITPTIGGFPEAPRGAQAYTTMLPLGERILAIRCVDGATSALVLSGVTWSLVTGAADLCSGVRFGRASATGRLVIDRFTADGLTRTRAAYALNGNALAQATTPIVETVAMPFLSPQWVEEIKDGVFASLSHDATEWRYERTDGAKLSVPAKSDRVSWVRRTGDALEIVSGGTLANSDAPESWWRWNVDGDGALVDAGTVDVPLAASPGPWRLTGMFGEAFAETYVPGEDEALGIPTAAHVRSERGGALRIAAVPTTPCRERAACRAVGESYFLGPLAHGYGLYAMWTWRGSVFVWGAPLANRAVP